jgi:photosystem II stability/assembly factor-like uncharacterized protein
MKKILLLLLCMSFTASGSIYAQWIQQNSGIIFTLFSVSAVNNDIVWSCASGANILRTTDGGDTWINIGSNVPQPYGVETTIFAIDANTALFACYAGNPTVTYVYKTTNAGASWNLVFTQSLGFITGIWMKTAQQGFMVGWPTGGRWSLWRTSNGGINWDSTGMYIPESNPSNWSFENSLYYSGSYIWFGSRGRGIYHSTDDGNTWVLQDLTSGGFPYPSALWFDNLNTGFSSGNLNIIKTVNGGANWVIMNGTAGTEVVRGITGYGNEWWYVRDLDSNIYHSTDEGTTWSIQFSSSSHVGFKHITKARDGNCLWAVNISGNIYKYVIPAGIKPVSKEIPTVFTLYQNYPNPFNPVTKIRFEIPAIPAKNMFHVKLKIYDFSGKEVTVLINDELMPGTYEIQWDGLKFASGVYAYKLTAGEFSVTRLMVLIK